MDVMWCSNVHSQDATPTLSASASLVGLHFLPVSCVDLCYVWISVCLYLCHVCVTRMCVSHVCVSVSCVSCVCICVRDRQRLHFMLVIDLSISAHGWDHGTDSQECRSKELKDRVSTCAGPFDTLFLFLYFGGASGRPSFLGCQKAVNHASILNTMPWARPFFVC